MFCASFSRIIWVLCNRLKRSAGMRALPRLREIREEKAMSQRDLAEEAGVSADAIGRIERGLREAQPKTTRKLAEALGVEPAELMKEVK